MRSLLVLPASLACAATLAAQGPAPSSHEDSLAQARAEFEAGLKYDTGTVQLSGSLATVNLGTTLRYLPAKEAKRLLTEGWGNPPDAVEGVLGMIVPAGLSPLRKEGWGIIVSFEEQGYVNDSDAATIDYAQLLKTMQDGMADENKQRKDAGYPEVQIVGWAEQPHYDRATHKLYWAKELSFTGSTEHTLNYNIRVLGRRGVLVLNAVGTMDQLDQIRQATPAVLGAVEFNEGHRYADFTTGDKVAAVGVAGLILGGVAAKAGLFKVVWIAILALKKFILLGLAAVGAWVKRLFGKKKEDEAPPAGAAP